MLEAELTPAELARSDEYVERKREAEKLGRELQESHQDYEEIVEIFRDIGRNS